MFAKPKKSVSFKTPYSDKDIDSVVSTMRKQGFGDAGKYLDNSSFETRRFFENAVRRAAVVLLESFPTDQNGDVLGITQTQFVDTVYDNLESSGYLTSQHYLRGLDEDKPKQYDQRGLSKEDLTKLFQIYACHSMSTVVDKKYESVAEFSAKEYKMDTAQFCHAWMHLMRENLKHEQDEISLAETIALLHAALTRIESATSLPSQTMIRERLRFLSRPKVEELKTKLGRDDFILSLSESRTDVSRQRLNAYGLNAYGMNLILSMTIQKTAQIIHIPLIFTKKAQGTVCFADLSGNILEDLKDVVKMVQHIQTNPDVLGDMFENTRAYFPKRTFVTAKEKDVLPAPQSASQQANGSQFSARPSRARLAMLPGTASDLKDAPTPQQPAQVFSLPPQATSLGGMSRPGPSLFAAPPYDPNTRTFLGIKLAAAPDDKANNNNNNPSSP